MFYSINKGAGLSLSELDLVLDNLHNYQPTVNYKSLLSQWQIKGKGKLQNYTFSDLNSSTVYVNSTQFDYGCPTQWYTNTLQGGTLIPVTYYLVSTKTVLKCLFWLRVRHRWFPCCSSAASHWHGSQVCMCLCVRVCMWRSVLLQNVFLFCVFL